MHLYDQIEEGILVMMAEPYIGPEEWMLCIIRLIANQAHTPPAGTAPDFRAVLSPPTQNKRGLSKTANFEHHFPYSSLI